MTKRSFPGPRNDSFVTDYRAIPVEWWSGGHGYAARMVTLGEVAAVHAGAVSVATLQTVAQDFAAVAARAAGTVS